MTDYPNIIFIVIDTLRKDYAKPLEEELKKLGFISYENVIAPASWTTPSHASIFTGLYPALHGAHETKAQKDLNVKLSSRFPLLSEILYEGGYNTYMFTANPYINPKFGFRGFTKIEDVLFIPKGKYKRLIWHLAKKWPLDKGASHFISSISKLEISHEEHFFIFANLMEVHEPYLVFDKMGSEFKINLKTNRINQHLVQKWKKKYPKEVEYVTKKLIELVRILKIKNIFNDSLIIITSDHGQLLGEYGRIGHGTFLYDELLKVPLLVKYPKGYEVEHVWNRSKYISLVKLKPFILKIIENKLSDDSILYSDIVFAESYGVHIDIDNISNEIERKNIEQLDKYRIAIYYKNFKGIFNVEEWKFESIISYDSKTEIDGNVVKHMKKEVSKFLKTVTITKVLKIKP
ncbi:sulfatase-like hydrolase/transferase [Pyrococcus sp. ST04]|uniref:sulfatase-like hydrolase/transferase n=1 Tax=Pyrococcus sp. ST04 TaxID=1183377 RepID=UPI0002605A80|nr:sulfatase-like hydrolase/transferase [Pyrococcus sp. ST04]AFK22065.1 hypothetical protein Py04_0463 [Pyrococcus sp. ST04]